MWSSAMLSVMRHFLLLCLTLGVATEARGQPEWFGSPPSPTSAVTFVSGAGTGTTRAQARRDAYRSALRQLARRDSATVSSALTEEVREILQESAASGLEGRTEEEVRARMEVDRRATTVPGLRPIERTHKGSGRGVQVWSLFAVPRPAGINDRQVGEDLSQLRAQRRRAVRWRSFVPGLAQFYKGQHAKGLLFLGGEAAMGALVVAGLYGQKRLQEKIDESASGPRRRTYEDTKARLSAMTWAGAALAGGLYVWNVADGWTASSERFPLLSVSIERGPIQRVRLAPVVTPRSGGAALTIALR
jgi:hypothetical protein